MELSDIKKSLSECTEEELRSMLMGIRSNRRTAKAKPEAKRTTTRAPKAKSEPSFDALASGMTKEQLLQLMTLMKGK